MIEPSEISKYLTYNESTGDFVWAVNTDRRRQGEKAGCVSPDGYVYIKINNAQYLAHRLAFATTYGRWPVQVDHIDMNRSNNKLSNLREASITENNRNRKAQSNNTSGFKGVSFHKGEKKYHARISIDKKRISLGYFTTAEEASAAYIKASGEHHGQFARS